MKFTREQTQTAYKNLPDEVQNFVMDSETTETISGLLSGAGLTEENTYSADSELLYAMFGLQTLDQALSSISANSGKSISDLATLRAELSDQIFSKIPQVNPNKQTPAQDWRARVGEIAEKYGLNPLQKNALSSLCEIVFSSTDRKNEIFAGLDEKLGISQVTSEQILEELEKRVFSLSATAPQDKKIETVTRSPIPKMIMPEKRGEVSTPVSVPSFLRKNEPDETPLNLPVSDEDKELVQEKVNIPRYIPSKVEVVKEEEAKKYEDLKKETVNQMYSTPVNFEVPQGFSSPIGSRITYKPANSGLVKPDEVVQKAYQVPRLNLSLDAQKTPGPVAPAEPVIPKFVPEVTTPAVESETVVPPISEPVQTTPTPKPSIPIAKSYSVDPYREPIE